MRRPVTEEKLHRFMKQLAEEAGSPGHVYFTGGVTALLLHIRAQTIDVDLKFDPEPRGVFEALSRLKTLFDLNVELAAPSDFIAVTPDWKQASLFIAEIGSVRYFHFDLRAQILAKIERNHSHDLADARAFQAAGHLRDEELWEYFQRTKPGLLRYPSITPETFERKVLSYLGRS